MRMPTILAALALVTTGTLPGGVAAQDDTPIPPTVPAAEAEISAGDLMGKQVVDALGDTLGQVSDVIIDAETGRVVRLVISSGGVWGIGDDVVAIDVDAVELSPGEGTIIAPGLTKSEVERYAEGAPEPPEDDAEAEDEAALPLLPDE